MSRVTLAGLRVRLIAVVMLALVPAAALILYQSWSEYGSDKRQAEATAMRMAESTAEEQEQLLANARQTLATLAQLPAVRGPDRSGCHDLLAGLMRASSSYTAISVVDLNGNRLCGSSAASGINVADRSYFQGAIATRGFAFGEYTMGAVSGRAVIALAYPVFEDGGDMVAVVVAPLDLAWFNQHAARLSLPEGATFTVMDRSGTVIARQPEPERWVGRPGPEFRLAQSARDSGRQLAEAEDADGVERVFGFSSLEPAPGAVLVSIGIPRELIFAEVRSDLRRNLLAFALVALLALTAAWFGGDIFFARRLRRLTAATRRLAAGDLSVRAGPAFGCGEIGELAGAFDQMAGALQQRQQEASDAAEALRIREQELAQVIETMTEAVIIYDREGRFLRTNVAAEHLVGHDRDDFADASYNHTPWPRLTLAGDPLLPEQHPFAIVARTGRPLRDFEFQIERPDGERRVVEMNAAPLHDAAGAFAGVVAVASDVTERKRSEEALLRSRAQLAEQALTDPLTGLANRRLFEDQLNRALATPAVGAAVLILDLDGFKSVNDELGHAAGDLVLGEVAARLAPLVRPADTVARFGGDEFTAVLHDVTSAAGALRVAQRMIDALDAPIVVDGHSVSVGASVGVAMAPNDPISGEDLLRRADVALYQAKLAGKGRAMLFTPGMSAWRLTA